MNKYDNAKIYKITSSKTNEIYIGSTILSLNKRFSNHKQNYKRWLKGQMNKITSIDLLQYDDCKIELIKNFPCENRKQLSKEEGKYIRENNCVNICVPGRTKKESDKAYREANKEKISEKKKEYREANKEKIREKQLEKFNCPCGGKYTYSHKAEHLKSKKHLNFIANQN